MDAGLEVVALASRHELAADFGERHGFEVRSADRLSEALDGIEADVLLSIANLRIVPRSILDRFEVSINFHDGPLPRIAGVHVTSWALANGHREHGITWHLMTETADAGEIVLADDFDIDDNDTAFALNARCFERALATFPDVAAALSTGRLSVTAQSSEPGEYHGRHERFGARALFDPRRSENDMRDVMRALDFGPRIVNPLGAMRVVNGKDAWLVDTDGRTTTLSGGESSPVAREAHELTPSSALCAALDAHDAALSRSEVATRSMLAAASATPVAGIEFTGDIGRATDTRSWSSVVVPGDDATPADLAAAGVLWLARTVGGGHATVAIADRPTRDIVASLAPLARRPLLSIDAQAAHLQRERLRRAGRAAMRAVALVRAMARRCRRTRPCAAGPRRQRCPVDGSAPRHRRGCRRRLVVRT